jgi:hypothetical protein
VSYETHRGSAPSIRTYMAINLASVQAQNARLRLCASAIGELISMLDYYLKTPLSEFSLMDILG